MAYVHAPHGHYSGGYKSGKTSAKPKTSKPATEKQIEWIGKCLQDKVLTPAQAKLAQDALAAGNLTVSQASPILDMLFAAPWKPKQDAQSTPKVPAWVIPASEYPAVTTGRYAVPKASGGWTFFYVRLVTHPKYAPRLSVKQIIGGHADASLEGNAGRAVLDLVTDVAEAQTAYGLHSGFCPGCGLQLTDEASLTVGWGPDCAASHGIAHPGYKAKKAAKPQAML